MGGLLRYLVDFEARFGKGDRPTGIGGWNLPLVHPEVQTTASRHPRTPTNDRKT
jgi:hypothetical protein